MRCNNFTLKVIILLLILTFPLSSFCRTLYDPDDFKNRFSYSAVTPEYCIAEHNVGKIVLAVNNNGTFGDGFAAGSPSDCFTGVTVSSCEYPKNTNSFYLFAGAFWIGAVVGRDTLVSVGADGWQQTREFFPDEAQFGGKMVFRSIIDPAKPEFTDAISEQDYISVYTDTFTTGVSGLDNDAVDGRSHLPLYIEVTQRSYAWSYPYAEDFVLFDYAIKNIGQEKLTQVYMGVYVDADVKTQGSDEGFDDDVCGFLYTYNNPYGNCIFEDTVFIAWIADNDGDFSGGLLSTPVPHVTATRIVRTPSEDLEVSFNWWVSNGTTSLDFGPRKKIANFRDLGFGQLGTPEGDRNKYDFLRNMEFDYDQVYTADISATDPVWLYPPQTIAKDISDGFDTRYLLSFGPFNIDPGQNLPISFAYLAGENFHNSSNPDNSEDNLTNNYNPDQYYANLYFDDLSLNAMWASWVYDNPGVDSDDDTRFGEYRLCCADTNIIIETLSVDPLDTLVDTLYNECDTFWYKGDNVPDFRGASPPPAPSSWTSIKAKDGTSISVNSMRVFPTVGKITVRWNGLRSETTRDVFSREYDFEGYRVYMARDERETSYSLIASYDVEDYNRYDYDAVNNIWELNETPFTIEELRCLYGDTINGSPCNDTLFDPNEYTRSSPYITFDTLSNIVTYYFEPQDFNRSVFANYSDATTPIRKVYSDQPYPSNLNPDSADTSELTDDGFFKYFEYEYTITNLLPTVSYYINVTAFDFGSPQSGLGSLETSKTNMSEMAYPLYSVDSVDAKNLEVYVYPNPYRIDGNYITDGYEGRDADYYIPDRMRRLNFANLPAKCTIRIYSLDGDMIREIKHDVDPNDPTAMHEEWDLITRNTQRIVTGIYYWVVEKENGDTQIGKFVIIM